MQQNAAPAPANALPVVFQDSLALRAKQIRFRGIGNPYAFLDSIGLVPIKEFLFRGANMIDIADVLNIPLTLLHNWIDSNNHTAEIEAASVISAEGYIYKGEQLLKNAENKFELDKAKAMLEHGRFMASKKDKKKYGTQAELLAPGAGVTYIFNITEPTEPAPTPQVTVENTQAIDAEFSEVPSVNLDLEFDIDGQQKPTHLDQVEEPTRIKAVEPTAPARGIDTWEQ